MAAEVEKQNTPGNGSSPNEVRFVVAIGTSAGGLAALEGLLKSLTPPYDVAFIVVQHMSPSAHSSLDEILARFTSMNVVRVQQRMPLAPNTVFLIPAGKEIRLDGNEFEVSHLDRDEIPRPIDTFFHSVAHSHGEHSIGIVLSGTGSDGAAGIATIHKMGGSTLAESIKSAQFDGMPRNAIATDCVDSVLPVDKIGHWLDQRFKNPDTDPRMPRILNDEKLSGIQLIFSLLTERHSIDFSCYKPATVARRIERRQQMIHKNSILDYGEFLRGNVEELDLLYHDLLIGVTKFFRDTDAFLRVEKEITLQVSELPEGDEYRVWVAGCATGEEPYSIAMLCQEAFLKANKTPKFKIFATDAHGGSLDRASRGVFNQSSLEFVGLDRQQNFFIRESEDSFRIIPELRRHIVFARHNVVEDPPFTKMDLVSCRNLLIYLQTDAQLKAIRSFHFALKRSGIMFMGASESPGKMIEEFGVVDDTWKLYRKTKHLPSPFRSMSDKQTSLMQRPRRLVNLLNSDRPEAMSFTGLIEGYDLILSEFIDSGLLLDDKKNVLHVFGDANRYLASSSGRFTGSIMDFLIGETKVAVAAALIRASKDVGKQVVLEGLEFPTNYDDSQAIDLHVKALSGHSASAFVWFVAFVPREFKAKKEASDNAKPIQVEIATDAYAAMESELIYTKDNLSATIEQVETSNEELQATNEELVSSNEELQSTNEELHSVNEELYSVNAENQRKIEALEEMTDDVDNLLASTDIGIIFLDAEMQVRKFTKAASAYVKLLPSDIGRSISDFATHIETKDFHQNIKRVIETGNPHSETVQSKAGKEILVRLMPYLSSKKVKGAIVNFIEMEK